MEIREAIRQRISCRAYGNRMMDEALVRELEETIAQINQDSGLRFQLCGPYDSGEPAVSMSDKMFVGPVFCTAALVAQDTLDEGEKVGYYGERLVLRATQLGLGTCWVASTYDRSTLRLELEEGERLWDIIPLGYAADKTPLKQRTIRAGLRRLDKKPQDLIEADVPFDSLPEWIRQGIEAVILGPSAINGQPVVFTYKEGQLSAGLPRYKRDIEMNDLGIAKLHFELAAKEAGVTGSWEWGCGGRFRLP